MTKNNLDVDASVAALFALCSDVTRLSVHGSGFFYLNPKQRHNLKVMQYILRANGVRFEMHRSRYYNGGYGEKKLILRVPVYSIVHNAKPGFREQFENVYQDRYSALNGAEVDERSVRFFRLMSAAKKRALVNELMPNAK